jgi:hypothetical protein
MGSSLGNVRRAGGGYLTNISPSKFAQMYENLLPEKMSGAEFLAKYDDHWDTATHVQVCGFPYCLSVK